MWQTRPWEFGVKYNPQRDWIEGHGILIAFAIFFGGIAGGLYLASVYFNSMPGMFIAMLLAVVTGLIDMSHLSKPLRAWRMLFRPGSSWITRGFIFIALFIGAAAIQLALSQWAPGMLETVFKIIASLLAFCVAIYSGFVVGYVSAIKLWNSAIVPLLFVVAGLSGGLAILILASLGAVDTVLLSVARLSLITIGVYAVSILVYLWGASYGSSGARYSVRSILKGELALMFWLGVVVVGILLPAAILAPFVLAGNTAPAAFAVAAVGTIIGGMALRYSILKAGVYSPLLPEE